MRISNPELDRLINEAVEYTTWLQEQPDVDPDELHQAHVTVTVMHELRAWRIINGGKVLEPVYETEYGMQEQQ